MDTKDGIIKKQESELAQLIEIRMRTFIEDDKNSKAIDWINLGSKRIAQEWFAYRSRLEPDKPNDASVTDCEHYKDGDCVAGFNDKGCMGKCIHFHPIVKSVEPDKKSADFTDEDMNHAITGE